MRTLIFVYNADSGLFNTLTDMAHKVFAPDTYSCNLCAITYGNFGMRQEWRDFLEVLKMPMIFLHRDEFHQQFGMQDVPLPMILLREGEQVSVLVTAAEINRCSDIEDLKMLLRMKLQ